MLRIRESECTISERPRSSGPKFNCTGKGLESYNFVQNPTQDNPSAMWSNYTGCERLIYIPNNNNAKRYLLGCESVNCCWEDQEGNQVELPAPPKILTEWEIKKFGLKDTGYKPIEIEPKKLIQFV